MVWAALFVSMPAMAPAAVASGTAVPAPPDGGATTTTTAPAASAPLVPIPEGCQKPPVASVVFIGRVLAKDDRAARFQVEQVRAGTTAGYALGNLIDVRYESDIEFLNVDDEYLVGAVPQGIDLALTSKVREAKPLLGGNAVVGLTEKSSECPRLEDPVRTFHVDGSPIEASMFKGLSSKKKQIAMAFIKPMLAVAGIVLALALVRWLLTAIVLAVRHAAENDPSVVGRRE
jgi:hypothetical protein